MTTISHLASGAAGAVLVCATMVLSGAAQPGVRGTIDVQRINIREPDGTLRMVRSGAATEPGIIVDNREQPHPSRRSAGILFYNDEGTENGGLIFDGKSDADGTRHSGGSLTFDRYKQDQAVQVEASEDGQQRHAGLVVNDHPDAIMDFAAIARAARLPPARRAAAYRAANVETTRRVFLGRTADGSSELELKDGRGNSRLALGVDAGGRPTIRFLDEGGRVVRSIAPD